MTDSTQSETSTEVMQHFTVSVEQAARIREALEGCGEWRLTVRVGKDWHFHKDSHLLSREAHLRTGVDGFALGLMFNARTCRALPDFKSFDGLPVAHISFGGFPSNPTAIANIHGLAQLACLTSVDLADATALTDISPLKELPHLANLDLSGCWALVDVSPLATLRALATIDLSDCRKLTNLSSLSDLHDLTTLKLAKCSILTDLRPLATLHHLASLDLRECPLLADLSALTTFRSLAKLELSYYRAFTNLSHLTKLHALVDLHFEGGESLTDLSPIADLHHLTSLTVIGSQTLADLGPIAKVHSLTRLTIIGSPTLIDIGPLSSLRRVAGLRFRSCTALADLRPIADLHDLTTLTLDDCPSLTNLEPIAGLHNITSVSLNNLKSLEDLSPLNGLRSLTKLCVTKCPRVAHVANLSAIPLLETLDLTGSVNIRDVEGILPALSLRELQFDRHALRDGVMLAIATRRRDPDLLSRVRAMLATLLTSETSTLHAKRIVTAITVLMGVVSAEDLSAVLAHAATIFRARGTEASGDDDNISMQAWERFLAVCITAPDSAFRSAFERVLASLSHSDAERVLAPALLALSNAPESARAWALELGRSALIGLPDAQARIIAPAAAVFFQSLGLMNEVEAWVERASVKGADAWRDRVFVAFIERALQLEDLLHARHWLAQIVTIERRDEGRTHIAETLAKREDFAGAADELQRLEGDEQRTVAAKKLLAQSPRIASDEHASLALLLALDGEPVWLGAIVASVIEQRPESPLAGALAKVFTPLGVPGVIEAVHAVLDDERVRQLTVPLDLARLRAGLAADVSFRARAAVDAAIALLLREELVVPRRAAELRAALSGGAP